MKHLFKLKKDGKTVGYAEFQKYGRKDKRQPNDLIFRYSRDMKTWDGSLGIMMLFDEALPYVTDDKNGEPVFAGDKIVMFGQSFIVVWNEREMGYYLKDHYKAQIKLSHINRKNIELLKDDDK